MEVDDIEDYLVAQKEIKIDENLITNKEVLQIIRNCCIFDHGQRPTAGEIYEQL